MSQAKVILRNVAANWVGFAINAIVTLALTPFILGHLGPAAYGIWVLSASVIGYYGLLDLGFRVGVTQYLTRYMAAGDTERASACMSGAVAALGALGLMMLVLSVAAAYLVPARLDLTPQLAHETFWCILIVGSSAGIQFALQPFGSVFIAMQRFDLANLIGVITRLLTALSVFLALHFDYGLIGISLATCGVSSIDYLIRWQVAKRLAPQLHIRRNLVSLSSIKEIGSFGLWNFLASINQYVYQHVPNMLIGAFMPIAAVGQYALGVGLARQLNSVLMPMGTVMYPAAAAFDARADRTRLAKLYHDGSRLMLLVMMPIVLIASFWAEDFYRLWIGERYLSGGAFHSVAVVFQILLIATVTNFSNIGGHILTGAGYVRVVALALLCGSVINLSFSVLLIHYFGLAGVAAGTVIASFVIDLIAMPLLVQRFLNLSWKDLVRNAALRPLLTGSLQLLIVIGVRSLGAPAHWFDLFVQCALAGIASLSITTLIGVTAEERDRFVGRPVRRLLGRVVAINRSPGV